MDDKIYAVTNRKTGEVRLVRTGNRHRALSYAAKNEFFVDLAKQALLVDLLTKGVKVEEPVVDDIPL